MSILSPRIADAITEHSICHPGRPEPHGDDQKGSPGLDAFQSAKSAVDLRPVLFERAPEGGLRSEAIGDWWECIYLHLLPIILCSLYSTALIWRTCGARSSRICLCQSRHCQRPRKRTRSGQSV